MAESIISVRCGDIAIRQSPGRKLPVLLLHGNSMSKDAFERQFHSPLGQEYRLVAMDLPGHGGSSDAFDAPATYSFPGYASAVIEVLERLNIDKIAVVGWSLGGHVGLELLSSFPGLIGLMITGAPPIGCSVEAILAGFHQHPSLALAGKQDLTEEDVGNFAAAALGRVHAPALLSAIRRADGRARQLTFASLFAGNLSDERRAVETISTPIAVVNGAEDPFVNNGYIQSLAFANLWERKCHLIPRAGHAPFLEAPEVFNHLLARFLHRMEAVARHRPRQPAPARPENARSVR